MTRPLIELDVRGDKRVFDTLAKVGPRRAVSLTRALVGALGSELVKDAKRNMTFGSLSTGAMKRGTKLHRRAVRNDIARADVVVGRSKAGGRRAFWWRFHEYGARNGVPEKAMFGRALAKMRPVLPKRMHEIFFIKYAAMLARERKKLGGG